MSERTGITVVGSGTAAAAVDQVQINLAVEVTRAQLGEAFTTVAQTVTALLTILADGGVESRSVRTTNLSLGPAWDHNHGQPRLAGYQAGQRLIVRVVGVHGLDRLLGDIATLGAEGVRIDNLSMTPGSPGQALAQARDAAFADAKARAEQLAGLAGRRLGPVQSVQEAPGGGHPDWIPQSTGAFSRQSMPVAAGETDVAVELTVHWSFVD
ncbi:DUF541 domain-containing protein [Nakamurella flava]|uniref:DUF541 domain-containing protein n=1 Tax=Nakamurella flava TaxID=2576308 RepID=A0A4U6QAV8_9ACTN|nr:SIMPL domain-containing protein [Nakamurella flava]TKV57090.1 DUF541 domain-containing protein [Nakamurella flava]